MKTFASHDDVPAGIETLQRVLKPGNVVLLDGYVGKTLTRLNDRVKHEFSDTDYAVFTGVILASTSEEDMGTITEAEYKKWLNGGRVEKSLMVIVEDGYVGDSVYKVNGGWEKYLSGRDDADRTVIDVDSLDMDLILKGEEQ